MSKTNHVNEDTELSNQSSVTSVTCTILFKNVSDKKT